MAEKAMENQAIEIRRNEDGGPDSDVDNSDKDDAANSKAEFESLHGSDEEQGMQYPVFDTKHMDNPNLEIGMVFSSFRKFKAAVRSWNIKKGKPFKFVKSDKIRVRVRRSNLGTTVVMKMVDGYCDTSTNRPKFQRLYMCFTAVREGFLARCRPLFGLDGTFLKKSIRGMLLISVGIDPNNGFFPIAYAACEGQNKDSWAWFLNLLKEDLMIKRDYEWTLMSNKQKGIIQACESVFPNVDHRFCVKHLQSNWSQAIFKGKALSNTLWAAVKATTTA
ncbi:hypothetical protein ACH5RR_012681 [Cinchona calisaya]|uniref:MULE transposase domain-containing protein n=1 Tax=Cinchona calisaya TaxID=153742 RepID=A0ABD3ABU7_9GENT